MTLFVSDISPEGLFATLEGDFFLFTLMIFFTFFMTLMIFFFFFGESVVPTEEGIDVLVVSILCFEFKFSGFDVYVVVYDDLYIDDVVGSRLI